MTHLQVLIVAVVTWIAWIPAAAYEWLARDGRGRVSIFPVIPFFPLAAWGLAYVLPQGGASIVGLSHFALLIWMLISIAKSRRKLKSKDGWDA